MRALAVVLTSSLLLGCGKVRTPPEPGPAAVDPWASLAPTEAVDKNPDPRVVEVDLEARVSTVTLPGYPATTVWTYNGTLPGPLIEAKVGDELVVHFTNHLPEETTIHWHGVRLPNAMDGVMGVTPAIAPGGSFDYRFTLKDPGLFWYHPHVRSDEQVNKGLYGAIRVRGDDEPSTDADAVLVLDDLGLLANGSIPTYLDDESQMLGRGGPLLLINGQVKPTVTWRAGSLQRLRLVNAANGRFFNLRLEGHTFRVVGTDGGRFPRPFDAEHLLLPPGKRYDVELIPQGAADAEAVLWTDPYDRGHDTGKDPALPVATFRISAEAPLTGRSLMSEAKGPARLPEPAAVDHALVLDEGVDAQGQVRFTINGFSGMEVPVLTAPLGAVQKFTVRNDSPMDHPFHLHGFFFQVVERDGVRTAEERLTDEDTVVVPSKSRLSFVTRLDEPGMWPYHCHILEHAEAGMMGMLQVGP